MLGKLLCLVGIHRWDARATREYHGDGEYIVRDHNRCVRPGCPRYSRWAVMNTEVRRYF